MRGAGGGFRYVVRGWTVLVLAVGMPPALSGPAAIEVEASVQRPAEGERARARELGIRIGILEPGPGNGITDVEGVRVGHTTISEGEGIRTGVTAVLPHGGNLFREKVPAAIHVGNGFGKLTGISQVRELGNIETPILLTNTLSVPRVADAVITYTLEREGNGDVRSVNPVVGETNDGHLNDIRARAVTARHVLEAIRGASTGAVAEGSVGAGTGTVAFGYKGGIGTSSRRLPARLGGWTVGILVQSNFGGVLSIAGAPVGRALGRHFLKEELEAGKAPSSGGADRGDGSCMIVVATDAPLDARNLERVAARAMLGLARTGSPSTNGSGDYVIAFSTAPGVRVRSPGAEPAAGEAGRGGAEAAPAVERVLSNAEMSPLFLAAVEATEEAIVNSLLMATSVTGFRGRRVEALPIPEVVEICRRHGVLPASGADSARGHDGSGDRTAGEDEETG